MAGTLIGVALIYAGLGTISLGAISLLKPLAFLGIRTRFAGGIVLAAGFLLVVAAVLLPAPLQHGSGEQALDNFVPAYQFYEVHSVMIQAPPEAVYAAVKSVTAPEIHWYRVLAWLRSPHLGRAPESVLNPPLDRPIVEVFLRSGFMLLADDPGREVVFGTIRGRCNPTLRQTQAKEWATHPQPEDFLRFNPPRCVKIAANFRLRPAMGGATLLTTETRVYATDSTVARRFAAYWRVIYPGSSWIRVMWLDAIKRRAEGK
jgi:hypothetical protein